MNGERFMAGYEWTERILGVWDEWIYHRVSFKLDCYYVCPLMHGSLLLYYRAKIYDIVSLYAAISFIMAIQK